MGEDFGEVELAVFDEVDVLDLVALVVEGGFVLAGDLTHVVEKGLYTVTVDFFEELQVE